MATREEVHAALKEVQDAVHDEHVGADSARLAQLNAHLATVAMVVDELFNAQERGEH